MPAELLKGGRLARTERVLFRGAPAVRKTLKTTPRVPLLSPTIEGWLAGREWRQLRRAEGIPGVVRPLARPAPGVFLREWVPGVALGRASPPPRAFYEELLAIVRALHGRGITHNDLHKEANVIVRPDGRPVLIDFQLSITLPVDSVLNRLLARFDVYHVLKNRRHRTGLPFDPEEQALVDSTRRLRGIHRLVLKVPMNLLTRRLFPGVLRKLPTDTDP
jgi:RIO-like serine/threonine protein kinase